MGNPAQQQLRLTDERTIEYAEAGAADGPAVVYHQGTPGSTWLPSAIAKAASKRGRRLVSASRSGYGRCRRVAGRRPGVPAPTASSSRHCPGSRGAAGAALASLVAFRAHRCSRAGRSGRHTTRTGQRIEPRISRTMSIVVSGLRKASRATVSPSHLEGVTRAIWSRRSWCDHRR